MISVLCYFCVFCNHYRVRIENGRIENSLLCSSVSFKHHIMLKISLLKQFKYYLYRMKGDRSLFLKIIYFSYKISRPKVIIVFVNLKLFNLIPQSSTLLCIHLCIFCSHLHSSSRSTNSYKHRILNPPTPLFLPCDSAGVIIIYDMSRSLPFPTVNLLLLLILRSLWVFLCFFFSHEPP